MANLERNKKTFKILSVFEAIFAICASLSWSGGYILQEFIHVDPMSVAYDIWVTTFEFYFIGFPLALVFSFILLSINSDKKIMPQKPIILLCICPFVFAAGMYSMVIFQSNLFFLLGSIIISVGNILIQIYFITEIKKSKNYIPPIETSQTADSKKLNLFKGLASVNIALILITTASFLIPSWLELYDVINSSDSVVPLTVFMALGIIFSSILLNENAKEGILPAGTVNSAFAFNFLFPIIVWVSHEIGFELEFTGPDYTPEVITGSIPIKVCSVIFSLIAVTIAASLIRGIVKMKTESTYSILAHKKSSLWTLYALNIFPAIMYIMSKYTDYRIFVSDIKFEVAHRDEPPQVTRALTILSDETYKRVYDFKELIHFNTDTESFIFRFLLSAVLMIICLALMTSIGKKCVFSSKAALFVFSPFIVSIISHIIMLFDTGSIVDYGSYVYAVSSYISIFGAFLMIATQIFIIVKLIKFSKTKEIA